MMAQIPASFLGVVSASGKAQCRHVLDSAKRTSWADAHWQTLAPFSKQFLMSFLIFLCSEEAIKSLFLTRGLPPSMGRITAGEVAS